MCCSGSEAEIQDAIKAGADINGKDRNGKTPLQHAVDNSNIDVILALLKLGASIDPPDNRKTALIYAATHANRKKLSAVLKALINAGADVNEVADDYSDTSALILPFRQY